MSVREEAQPAMQYLTHIPKEEGTRCKAQLPLQWTYALASRGNP
jgi:hypothetical protein